MITSCIIVTKDRPNELQQCVASLQQQTQQLDQIIVVDGGQSALSETILSQLRRHSPALEYFTSTPGITRQRNLARARVRADCDIVLYVDDDTTLASDAIEKMQLVFQHQPDAVGVTGQIEGEPAAGFGKRLLGTITLLYTSQPFGLTRGLFNIINAPKQPQAVAWLPGACMAYRWAVVQKQSFDEWFTGYGLGEDLDFSLQVKQFGRLWVDPAIKAHHHHAASGRDWFKFGLMRIKNRNYIRQKHFAGQWSYWLGLWWANSWLLILNVLRGVAAQRYRAELKGELRGLFS